MATYRTYTYTCATYTILAALTGVTPGDVAYTQDFGYHWKYDGVNGIWRILGQFLSPLAANLSSLTGMQPGDFAYAEDTGAMYFYSLANGSAQWVKVQFSIQ